MSEQPGRAAPPVTEGPSAEPPRKRPRGGRLRGLLSGGWLNRFPRRRVVLAAVAVLVLGVFVAGFGLGWTASRIAGPGALPNTTVQVVAAPTQGGSGAVTLPDVRGLALADAQQAMADAGLPPGAITVTQAPAALPEGTVLKQDPIGGTTGATKVTLYAAVPGTVPPVVGQPADQAVQTLRDLGTSVRRVAKYTPGTPEGTVLAVEPAAGQPLAAEVTLTVSGPADSVFLAQITKVQGSCGSGSASVDGKTYDHSVTCSPGSSPATTAYLLNRQVTALQGVVGLSDSGDPHGTAAVRVVGDGKVLLDTTVAYGTATPLALDVSNVLRLEITYSASTPGSGTRLVLGDVRLVGDPAGIAALDSK